jgi:hypothetical protein
MTADIISLEERREDALATLHEHRESYARHKRAAEAGLRIGDGIAAGVAFARFADALRAAGREVTDRDIDRPLSLHAGELAEEVVARLRVATRKARQ